MKKLLKIFSLVLVPVCICSLKALAIDDDGGIGNDVPIDGGLSLLLVAGMGYGVQRITKNKQRTKLNNVNH